MTQEQPSPMPATVALVCGEPRLSRILRLALEAGGYGVRECSGPLEVAAPSAVAAAVVDLDSLRPQPAALGPHLRSHGLPETLPMLFISVYPAGVEERPRPGPTDYLQPPFPADEVAVRVERLLHATGRPGGRLASTG